LLNYVNVLLKLPMIHVGLPLNSLLRHGDRLKYAKVLDPQSQSLVEVLIQDFTFVQTG